MLISEAGLRDSERERGSKMNVVQLSRNVPPRITDTDVVRMTDDGRPYPSNKINTKQYPKGYS